MGWEDRIKPQSDSGWESRIQPMSEDVEQQGMAAATLAADEKFESEDYSELESAMWGLGQGATFNLVDESAGGIKAIRDTLFGDRLAKDFPESYRKSRDLAREMLHDAEAANPKSYLSGQIAGGTALMAVPALNVVKGANIGRNLGALALEGGLHGYGATEEEKPIEQLKDVGKGIAYAGIGGGAGAGVGKIARGVGSKIGGSKIGSKIKDTGKGLSNLGKTYKEATGHPDIKYLPDFAKSVAGVKETIKAIADTKTKRKEFNQLLNTRGRLEFDGTDEEFVLTHLLADGPNPIKDWVADKSATLLPGQIDSPMLKRVLDIPMDKRSAARQFDRKGAGEELLPEFTDAYKATRKASGEAYERLTSEAREAFEPVGDAPVQMIQDALDYAGSRESIGGNVGAVLRDAKKDLGEDFARISPQDQFDRLSKIRTDIGKMVPWSKKNELPEGQKVIQDVYNSLSHSLQASDEKKAGDALYSTFKTFEDDLFKQVSSVRRGKISDFDSIKLEKLFKESDSGRRLMKQINKAKKAITDGDLSADEASTLLKVISKVEEIKDLADSKRLIDAFRFKQGPSSPSIERQASAMGGSKPLTEAIESPAGFINSADQFFPQEAQKRFGKAWNQLGPAERQKLIRLWTWQKKNPEAFPKRIEAAWQAIKDGM